MVTELDVELDLLGWPKSVLITLADETSENGQQENLHAMTVGMTGAPGRRRVVKSVQFDAIDRAAEIGGILRAGLKIRTPHGNIPASRARSQDRIDDLVLSKLGNLGKNNPQSWSFCKEDFCPIPVHEILRGFFF